MNQDDLAEFDAAEVALEKLRSAGASEEFLSHVEQAAKNTASGLWLVAKPVLSAGGKAAVEALASFAASALEAEIARLGR